MSSRLYFFAKPVARRSLLYISVPFLSVFLAQFVQAPCYGKDPDVGHHDRIHDH